MRDDLGIVVIGRNEGNRLVDCLKSIRSSVKCVVVYVDSGSTDGSPEIADGLKANVLKLDRSKPFTAARARNEGFNYIRKLNPSIQSVQFIDGDCELDESWLKIAINFLIENRDAAVACGRRRERDPSATLYNRLCDIEWDTPVGETLACGGDSFMRVVAVEAVDGFRSELIAGEEPELCLRLRAAGWKIWRLDNEMTRHDAAMTQFDQWWTRTVRSGFGITEVCLLHWWSPQSIWKAHLARTAFWGALLPAAIALGALMHPTILVATLIYPLQVCRIAIMRGPRRSSSWSYALFVMLAKFAEFQGVIKYCWRRTWHHTIELIEYK